MSSLIKSGKIKYYGLSNETPWGTSQYLKLADKHNIPKPITIQNPYDYSGSKLFDLNHSLVAA